MDEEPRIAVSDYAVGLTVEQRTALVFVAGRTINAAVRRANEWINRGYLPPFARPHAENTLRHYRTVMGMLGHDEPLSPDAVAVIEQALALPTEADA